MVINSFKIVYRIVGLEFFLLVCKSVQSRSWIRAVTLDLRWFVMKRAAVLQILFNLSISPCVYGSHTGQTYSKSDRIIEKYAISFNLEGRPLKFLLKKHSMELALPVILKM